MKLQLHADLIPIVTDYAWGKPVTEKRLLMLLQCCIECHRCIPPFFLSQVANPLIAGAPFCLFDEDIRLDTYLYDAISMVSRGFLRKNKIKRGPLKRLFDGSILVKWNTFLKRLGSLSIDDFELPHHSTVGMLQKLYTVRGMITFLPAAKPIKSKWKKLFTV